MARIYNDSKTFVDMKLKQPADETLKLFDDFMAKYTDTKPTKDEIQTWVEQHFDPAGSEFEQWIPSDYKKDPEILNKITDKALRGFAEELNGIWHDLGRKMKKEVQDNNDLYSIIWVDNPVIVPGGRFREFYYWDSYWIIRGLLISEMKDVSLINLFWNSLSLIKLYSTDSKGNAQEFPFDRWTLWLHPEWRTNLLLDAITTTALDTDD